MRFQFSLKIKKISGVIRNMVSILWSFLLLKEINAQKGQKGKVQNKWCNVFILISLFEYKKIDTIYIQYYR